MKSSRSKRKGFFDASYIGTRKSYCYLLSCFGNKHVLDLSKSMQLGSLLSNHSEEAAAPEPPKALMFFFGVTGTIMAKLSKPKEQARGVRINQ